MVARSAPSDQWHPANPDFAALLRENVRQPGFTQLLGTEIVDLQPGSCVLRIEQKPELQQHHGYFHGGVVGALADNSCGLAAGTLVAADQYPITVEYKVNFLRPATGQALVASGSVLRQGKSTFVCTSKVQVESGDGLRLCAVMLATLAPVAAGNEP